MASASDDLVRTRALFEQWRSTRQGRSKIPDELWQAAVALHGRYSASQLCRELHLSAGALRSRLEKVMPETASSRPTFVPLRAEPLGRGFAVNLAVGRHRAQEPLRMFERIL